MKPNRAKNVLVAEVVAAMAVAEAVEATAEEAAVEATAEAVAAVEATAAIATEPECLHSEHARIKTSCQPRRNSRGWLFLCDCCSETVRFQLRSNVRNRGSYFFRPRVPGKVR